MRKIMRIAALAKTCSVGTAKADVPIGLRQSHIDAQDILLHVRTRSCGGAICGQVERGVNQRAYDASSRTVGHRVLINMKADKTGSLSG